MDRLNERQFADQTAPIDALAGVGWEAVDASAQNLDSDPESEWAVALFMSGVPELVFDSLDGIWVVHPVVDYPQLYDHTSAEEDNDPPWVRLVGFAGGQEEDDTVFNYLGSLQADILAQVDPTGSHVDIAALQAYLPVDDDAAGLVHQRLLYLDALTYELEGNSEQAIAGYLALIEEAPRSVWAWLAWTRLSPGP
jgi:hypothetical protein